MPDVIREYGPALLLFLSQGLVVFLLVVQSRLNIHGHNRLAALNSGLIGAAQLVMWRIMPDPSAIEIVAFVASGPFGNVLAQHVNRRDVARIRRLHEEDDDGEEHGKR